MQIQVYTGICTGIVVCVASLLERSDWRWNKRTTKADECCFDLNAVSTVAILFIRAYEQLSMIEDNSPQRFEPLFSQVEWMACRVLYKLGRPLQVGLPAEELAELDSLSLDEVIKATRSASTAALKVIPTQLNFALSVHQKSGHV